MTLISRLKSCPSRITTTFPEAYFLKEGLLSRTAFRSRATALPSFDGITPSSISREKEYRSRFPRRLNSSGFKVYEPPPFLIRETIGTRSCSQRSMYKPSAIMMTIYFRFSLYFSLPAHSDNRKFLSMYPSI